MSHYVALMASNNRLGVTEMANIPFDGARSSGRSSAGVGYLLMAIVAISLAVPSAIITFAG